MVRQTLRGLDAKCAGLEPCAACAQGMLALAQLEDAGLLETASPNAQNKVMRLCADDLATVERIFRSLPEVDSASRTCLLEARLQNGNLDAAVAIIDSCDGDVFPRPRSCIAALRACCERGRGDLALIVWRQLHGRHIALDAPSYSALLCAAAHSPAEHAAALPAIAQAMADAGHAASPEAVDAVQLCGTLDANVSAPAAHALRILSIGGSRVERTLAIVKPDALAAGASPLIAARIREAGLTIVRQRRWRMDQAGAAEWLRVSWGGAAGGAHRRFFQELSAFYASGESSTGSVVSPQGDTHTSTPTEPTSKRPSPNRAFLLSAPSQTGLAHPSDSLSLAPRRSARALTRGQGRHRCVAPYARPRRPFRWPPEPPRVDSRALRDQQAGQRSSRGRQPSGRRARDRVGVRRGCGAAGRRV